MLSIIIPFYRNKEWLEVALTSVCIQTYRDYEIILVDDGSGIYIDDLMEKYGKLQIIHTENGGPAAARNKGIKAAKGDYIAFLDSDDVWLPDKLKKQLDFMISGGYRWSATGYRRFEDGNEHQPELDMPVKFYERSGMSVWQMMASTRIATPTVIIERALLEGSPALCFNENLRAGEDTCLWLSLAITAPLGYLEEDLARVRIHGSNAARSCSVQLEARTAIYDFVSSAYPEVSRQIPAGLKMAFRMCGAGTAILSFLKKLPLGKSGMELAAKMAYLPPWLLFKLNNIRFAGR